MEFSDVDKVQFFLLGLFWIACLLQNPFLPLIVFFMLMIYNKDSNFVKFGGFALNHSFQVPQFPNYKKTVVTLIF